MLTTMLVLAALLLLVWFDTVDVGGQ